MKMEKDYLNDKVLDKEKPYPPSKPVTSTAIRKHLSKARYRIIGFFVFGISLIF